MARHKFQACPVWISGYILRVTSQASYSPEYIALAQGGKNKLKYILKVFLKKFLATFCRVATTTVLKFQQENSGIKTLRLRQKNILTTKAKFAIFGILF
jgi:hypothetical protein